MFTVSPKELVIPEMGWGKLCKKARATKATYYFECLTKCVQIAHVEDRLEEEVCTRSESSTLINNFVGGEYKKNNKTTNPKPDPSGQELGRKFSFFIKTLVCTIKME